MGGSAFDPETGLLYANSNDVAWTAKLRENQELPSAQPSPIKPDIDLRDFTKWPDPDGYPTAIRRLRLHGEP